MEERDLSAAAYDWGTAQAAADAVAAAAVVATETPVVVAPLPSGDALPSDTPPAAAAPATPPAPVTPAEVYETIEAMLGTEKQALRADLLVPITVDGVEQMVPLKELRQHGMRQADYTRKTQELAEQRKATAQVERDAKLAAARAELQEKMVTAERERLILAQSDPEEYERYLSHAQRLATDPDYKALWERDQRNQFREAEDAAVATLDAEEQHAAIVADIADTAVEFAALPEFAGVTDADAVALFTQRLALPAGHPQRAELRTGFLHQAFADLAADHNKRVDPLQKRIDEMDATIKTLQAEKTVAEQNAVLRSRVPVSRSPAIVPRTQPNRAAPVAPNTEGVPRPRRIQSLESRAEEWANS